MIWQVISLIIAIAGIITGGVVIYSVARSRQNFELRRSHTDEIREALKAWNPEPAQCKLTFTGHLVDDDKDSKLLVDLVDKHLPQDVSQMRSHYYEYVSKKKQMVKVFHFLLELFQREKTNLLHREGEHLNLRLWRYSDEMDETQNFLMKSGFETVLYAQAKACVEGKRPERLRIVGESEFQLKLESSDSIVVATGDERAMEIIKKRMETIHKGQESCTLIKKAQALRKDIQALVPILIEDRDQILPITCLPGKCSYLGYGGSFAQRIKSILPLI